MEMSISKVSDEIEVLEATLEWKKSESILIPVA